MDCTHLEGRGHDCAYVNARNEWIPVAESWADFVCPPVPKCDGPDAQMARDNRRDVAFLRAMDFLVKHGHAAPWKDGIIPDNVKGLLLPHIFGAVA